MDQVRYNNHHPVNHIMIPVMPFNAILKQDITYPWNGAEIPVKMGTKIVVDTERMIALINNDVHVTIEIGEYEIIDLH